ncbi:transmembrane protein 150C isoform X2 [Siniperca chuatsi]|nr:transmembrane protein 150C isoform X2 [Siniperca chuatsi]
MIAPLGSKYRKINGSFYPPYISIAGNSPPASCIFSEVMNLAAFVGLIIAVLRYLQLKHIIDKVWLNVGSLVIFSIACFGMTLVGNFQLFTQKMIHNIGAFLAFGLGMLFCWAQSYITLRVNIKNEGRKAAIIRFLLSGSITVCMIAYFSLMSQRLHMQAAQCQWALVMFFLIFLGTFAIEFRHSRFDLVCTDDSERPLSQGETFSEVSRYVPDQL